MQAGLFQAVCYPAKMLSHNSKRQGLLAALNGCETGRSVGHNLDPAEPCCPVLAAVARGPLARAKTHEAWYGSHNLIRHDDSKERQTHTTLIMPVGT